jgi:hypothetical protein
MIGNINFSELSKAHRMARGQARLKRVLAPYAFAGPRDQPTRWHLFYDGARVVSAVCTGTGKTRTWSAGPAMSVDDLGNPEILQTRVGKLSKQGKRAGLGILLHLGDQLDQGLVQEEFENPEFFEHADSLVRESPFRVVTDLSDYLDPTIQWRYYPLLSGHRAMALRHHVKFLNAFETLAALDAKVAVYSAPVEMLALCLKLYEQAIEEKPHCFVLFYDQFTLLVPIHGGVLDIKVLSHRQQAVPPSFGDDLFSLLEKLGFVESCVLLLFRCGRREPTLLFQELDTYARRNQKNAEGVEIQIPDDEAIWSVLNEWTQGQLQQAIVQRPEFLSEYTEWFGKEFPLTLGVQGDLQRFGKLSNQTFGPDDQATRDKQLPRSLAILTIALRFGKVCGLLLLIGLGLSFAFSVTTAYHGEALKMLPEVIGARQSDFERLIGTKQYLSKWDKILTPRSQAWSAMDFVLGLVPEGNNVVCDKIDYTIKQADTKPNAGQSSAPRGFSRQWVTDGFCNEQGKVVLEHLQEASILTKIFALTSARLGDLSFAVSGDRTVKAVLREESNPQFAAASQVGALPYKFHLTVTQTIPGIDPLAFPALPKPKKTAMQQ